MTALACLLGITAIVWLLVKEHRETQEAARAWKREWDAFTDWHEWEASDEKEANDWNWPKRGEH